MVADRSDTPPAIYTNPSERQCPDGFFLYALSNMPVIHNTRSPASCLIIG